MTSRFTVQVDEFRLAMSRDLGRVQVKHGLGVTLTDRVSNGRTMDAILSELATGVPTGGRMHSTKGQETLNGLVNWLRRNPDASSSDRIVAQSLADDLSLVLRDDG